ncbi:MAG: glycosyltransferase family 9 protein [Bacteroidia bacterium]|nr:glycosyltransferase family 9 protein [Bacteroidia bacterium]
MRLFHNVPEKMLFAANALLSAWINFFGKKPLKANEILVVKIDEIGDMVSATPVFKLLKERFPHSQITLLCKPVCKTFMQYNPHVNTIICSEKEWQKKFDLVVELRGTRRTLLKSFRYMPSYRLDRGTVRFKYRSKSGNLSDRETNFLVVKPLIGDVKLPLPDFFSSPQDKVFVEDFVNNKHLQQFAIIHATSNQAIKEWSHQRFAELADWFIEKYGFKVVFIGAQTEFTRTEALIQQMKNSADNFAGTFTLSQLYEFCKKAAIYVGNDSGPMHIANVAGTPLVGLFGPVPRGVFYPFGNKAIVIHPQTNDRTGESPMSNISVAEVKSAVQKLIG